MDMKTAQQHSETVHSTTLHPDGSLVYDQVQIHGDGPNGYYLMARRNDDHTRWVRV